MDAHAPAPVTRSHRRTRSSSSAEVPASAKKRARLEESAVDMEHSELQNGHSHPEPPPQRLGSSQLIDRVEYVRVLEQALSALGFHDTAALLRKESSIALEPSDVGQLRAAVAAGAFDKAVAVVAQLPLDSAADTQQAQFLLLEQKYLEAVERRQTAAAVSCLRTQLAALAPPCDVARLHQLGACLLAGSTAHMHALAGWPAGATSAAQRQLLLHALQDIIPAALMLPDRRLEALVEQALQGQLAACMFHNHVAGPVSLLSDYRAGVEQLPTRTVQTAASRFPAWPLQVLEEHSDEVWHLRFSHDGSHLASCSKDMTACIWQVVEAAGSTRLEHRHTLRGHKKAVIFVAWSPDDSQLATGGGDGMLRIWSTAKGACTAEIKHDSTSSDKEVSAGVWLPDGQRIITSCPDMIMRMHSMQGELLRTWKGHRINDMALAHRGRHLLTTSAGKSEVRIYQLDGDGEAVLRTKESIVSMCVSSDSRHLLVHLATGRIQLMELPEDMSEPLEEEPLHTYDGPHPSARSGHWVIRSCFGGCNQGFVLSGSEECKVYVWHRGSGELLAQLEGHSGTVNAVSWNPRIHSMFASASDDCSVHIWGPAQS